MIDMRMPFTFGHSRAVAALAGAAGKHAGASRRRRSRRPLGGYTHDIGELAVPVSTWMKPARFSPRETDAAHLHPYHGERALAALGPRRPAGRGAGAAPSRAPRRQRLPPLRQGPRPLAGRPHPRRRRGLPDRDRGATAPAGRERRGRGRQACGRWSPRASSAPTPSEAVLTAAGQAVAPGTTPERLDGLTPREIEVLRLIAAGHTAKEAARQLEYLAQDRRQPHPEPLLQDRRLHPRRRRPLRARARPRSAGNSRRLEPSVLI